MLKTKLDLSNMANRTGKKFGGRSKGTPNKKTIDSLNRAESLLQMIESQLTVDDIKVLTTSKKLDLYTNLLEYVAPKLSRSDNRITANIHLSDEPINFE